MALPLEQQLRKEIEGEVRFDFLSRQIFSVDASIYEIEPVGIVLPKTQEDCQIAVQIATEAGIPIIGRGAATGIAGGCIGKGLIIDTSKYLNRITELNIEEGYVRCEPGVVQGQLNQAVAPYGLRLGPDTSTGNRATVGGMAANNSSGAHSLRYGKMVDVVEAIDIILSTGERLHFEEVTAKEEEQKQKCAGSEGSIYTEIARIREKYREEIKRHFPKIDRRVSGYNLDTLVSDQPLNLSKLIVGSEGSLGLITELKLQLHASPKHTGLILLHFHNLVEALQYVPHFLTFSPFALEVIDSKIIEMAHLSPAMRGKLEWLQGKPQALIVAEFEGETEAEVHDRMRRFAESCTNEKIGYATLSLRTSAEMDRIWELRKAGLGLLMSRRSWSRAIGFVEDIAVPPDKLASFISEFEEILRAGGKAEAGIYGHAGAGCLHLRPYVDLREQSEIARMQEIMENVADKLLEYGGTLSGEHGDGLVRSWLNEKMFGSTIYKAFQQVKRTFDPLALANPGKIVDAPPLDNELRIDPHSTLTPPTTFLNYDKEGGFDLAVDMCNGNAQCRKPNALMCPSYQATLDEECSTRARAQSLRSILHGRTPSDAFTSPELYRVLDLCLECKGCKAECPSLVDMAKLKAEFLYHYQERHGYPLRSRIFAHNHLVSRIGSLLAPLSNWMMNTSLNKKLLSKLGVATQRPLPHFSRKRCSSLLRKKVAHNKGREQVVLYIDTYAEFYNPEIGVSAHKVLTAMGLDVIIPPWSCCGRPMYSKGFLPQAQEMAHRVINTLAPYAVQGLPIIGLEPSCLLTIKEEYPALTPDSRIEAIQKQCVMLDTFLHERIKQLPLKGLKETPQEVIIHTHCHHKASGSGDHTQLILNNLPGVSASEIASGCCGLAGSFGYEQEHYELSKQIGELVLLPTIRKAASTTAIVANGFSCRHQIEHGSDRSARHLAQLVEERLP